MVAVLQTAFWISWQNSNWFKFHWDLFLWVWLTIIQPGVSSLCSLLVMVWVRTGDKSVPEPEWPKFHGAIFHHLSLLSWLTKLKHIGSVSRARDSANGTSLTFPDADKHQQQPGVMKKHQCACVSAEISRYCRRVRMEMHLWVAPVKLTKINHGT